MRVLSWLKLTEWKIIFRSLLSSILSLSLQGVAKKEDFCHLIHFELLKNLHWNSIVGGISSSIWETVWRENEDWRQWKYSLLSHYTCTLMYLYCVKILLYLQVNQSTTAPPRWHLKLLGSIPPVSYIFTINHNSELGLLWGTLFSVQYLKHEIKY